VRRAAEAEVAAVAQRVVQPAPAVQQLPVAALLPQQPRPPLLLEARRPHRFRPFREPAAPPEAREVRAARAALPAMPEEFR
jgi:hypothetical protein